MRLLVDDEPRTEEELESHRRAKERCPVSRPPSHVFLEHAVLICVHTSFTSSAARCHRARRPLRLRHSRQRTLGCFTPQSGRASGALVAAEPARSRSLLAHGHLGAASTRNCLPNLRGFGLRVLYG
jgi:hypothetical protein